jgi:hypothetical protein
MVKVTQDGVRTYETGSLNRPRNRRRRGKIPQGPHPRSNNMTPHFPKEFSTRLIDWSPFVIMGDTMPPRDPDEDEEDEDEEEEDRADEPPIVREPDED